MSKKSNTLGYLSILIALAALFFSYQSNQRSDEANVISKEANLLSVQANQKSDEANILSKEANQIATGKYELTKFVTEKEFKSKSEQIVDEAYNKIYHDHNNLEIMNKIKNQESLEDIGDLTLFIDIFEHVGDSYCKGIVYREDIRTPLFKTLEFVCNNTNIVNQFGNRKNGTAILCNDFLPNSSFAKNLKTENLGTCDFK